MYGKRYNRGDNFVSEIMAKRRGQLQSKLKGVFPRPREPLDPFVSEETDIDKKREQEREYPLSMMILDVTYEMAENRSFVKKHSGVYDARHEKVPLIIATGVNEKGETVAINVCGMFPYFYCDSSVLNRIDQCKHMDEVEKEEQRSFWCAVVCAELEKHMKERQSERSRKTNNAIKGDMVHSVTVDKKMSIYGFQGKQRSVFKIEMCQPFDVSKARKIIHDDGMLEAVQFGGCHQAYEANLEFVVRWLIDHKLKGCGWVTACDKDVTMIYHHQRTKFGRIKSLRDHRQTICDIEYMVNVNDTIPLNPGDNPRWARVAPLVVMSHDIEVKAARVGEFPTPDKAGCKVIDIGCLVSVYGKKNYHRLITFCLDTTNPPKTPYRDPKKDTIIPDPEVYSFDSESDMMLAWAQMQEEMQIDMTTGYNTYGFDTDYLYSRAEYLGIYQEFSKKTTKLPHRKVQLKQSGFTNRARGTNTFKLPTVVGNLMIDTYKAVQGDFFLKLRSYKLDNVAKKVLGRQKEDVHYTQINSYHETSDETRKKLVEYVNEDAILPLEILYKRSYIPAGIEQSRVVSVPLQWITVKGQQVKVIGGFMPYSKQDNMILPYMKIFSDDDSDILSRTAKDDEGYKGAIVLDPDPGYYTEPVLVLDFSSLYPSIMQQWNLCYSTWLSYTSKWLKWMVEGVHYLVSPVGHAFVKERVKHGVLPKGLKDTLTTRGIAKKAAAFAKKKYGKESEEYKREDSRQNALKMIANSMYGLTGATIGRLPCQPCAESVTAYGRLLIENTKAYVESMNDMYKVVYGDTDSVMIWMRGCDDVVEGMRHGQMIEDETNELLYSRHIVIERENAYYPWILMKKKMYSGLFWETEDKPLYIKSRGVLNVRRDNALFASNLYNKIVQTLFGWDQTLNGGNGGPIPPIVNKDTGEIVRPGWNMETKKMVGSTVDKVIQLIHTEMKRLHRGEVPIEELQISQAFSRPLENYRSKLPHIELIKKMRKRDAASAPKIGERVPYVIVAGNKDEKLSERAEDPKYVKDNNLNIDYTYYEYIQCRRPILKLLTYVVAHNLNINYNPKYDPSKDNDHEWMEDAVEHMDRNTIDSDIVSQITQLKNLDHSIIETSSGDMNICRKEGHNTIDSLNTMMNGVTNTKRSDTEVQAIASRILFPFIKTKVKKAPGKSSMFHSFVKAGTKRKKTQADQVAKHQTVMEKRRKKLNQGDSDQRGRASYLSMIRADWIS